MRYGRRDSNHAEVRDGIRRVPGVSVFDTADIGGGFVDLVVGIRGGVNLLLEVKDGKKPPSARALTKAEQDFFDSWQGQVAVVNSLDEALELIRFYLEQSNDR